MMASISISRRVQWMDTDAAGIWHHSVVIRWAEEAEAELHRRLGIIDETFGATPRVRTEFEFGVPLRFDEVVDITLTVGELGTTSITYDIDVSTASGQVANGRMVAVLIDRGTGEKRSWPDELRQVLSTAK
jgi:acyl-CoA thioester hydrolase